MSEEFGGKDMETVRLFDAYGALLTERQRKIAELYYNYDLSLGEIAEENGVSRQSVSDCLGKVDRRLKEYEKKLGFRACGEESFGVGGAAESGAARAYGSGGGAGGNSGKEGRIAWHCLRRSRSD